MNPKTKQRLHKQGFKWFINRLKHFFSNHTLKPKRKGMGMLLLVNAKVIKQGSPAFVDNIKHERVRPVKIYGLVGKHQIKVTLSEISLKDVDPIKDKVFVPNATRLYPHHRVKQFVIMDIENHEIFMLAPNELTRRDAIIKEGTVLPYIETEKGYARPDYNSNKLWYNTDTDTYKYYKQAINGIIGVSKTAKQKINVDFTLNLPE